MPRDGPLRHSAISGCGAASPGRHGSCYSRRRHEQYCISRGRHPALPRRRRVLVGVVYRLLVWRRVPQPALMTLYPTKGSGLAIAGQGGPVLPQPISRRHDPVALRLVLPRDLGPRVRRPPARRDRPDRSRAGQRRDRRRAAWPRSRPSPAASPASCSCATVLLLLGRRMFVARVREISTAPDFLALLLLVAVITTGDLMRFGGSHVDLAATRAWAASLLTLSPAVPLPAGGAPAPLLRRAAHPLRRLLEADALRRLLLHLLPHQEERSHERRPGKPSSSRSTPSRRAPGSAPVHGPVREVRHLRRGLPGLLRQAGPQVQSRPIART